MVNTLSGVNGWNGGFAASHFVRLSALRASAGAGFHPASLIIEVSPTLFWEADPPNLVVDVAWPPAPGRITYVCIDTIAYI